VSGLFIASKPKIEHDGTRRVLAVGRVKGALMETQFRFGDLAASGRRPDPELREQRQGEDT
jgi:hypothetical protein